MKIPMTVKKTSKAVSLKKDEGKPSGSRREFIRNGHSLRLTLESKGVGLMSSGSYCALKLRREAIDALLKEKSFTPKFRGYMVLSADKGTIVRPVQLVDNQRFVVNGKRMSTAVFEPGKCKLYSPKQFSAVLANGTWTATIHWNAQKTDLKGLVVGSKNASYSTMLYVKDGKIAVKDVEPTPNVHNRKEVVSLVNTDRDFSSTLRQIRAKL